MFFFVKRRRSEIPEPLAASSIRTSDAVRTSFFRWPSEMRTKQLLRWIIDFGRQR
jgi:hypothetical protein